MKLITNTKLAIASALCALVFTTAAQAQGVRVSVPFKFRAGDTMLAPGDYQVQLDRYRSRLTVTSPDGSVAMYVPVRSFFEGISEKASLTFNKYGNAYFLAKVKTAGAGGGETFTSAAEREARKTARPAEVAKLEIPAR